MTKLANRVISVFDRKTSMRLAALEWNAVDAICKLENIKRKKLFELIESNKDPQLGFTCSVRLFAITHLHNLLAANMQKIKRKGDQKSILETINKMYYN